MSAEQDAKGKRTNSMWQNAHVRRIVIYGAVLIIVFLAGFIPMWSTAREHAAQLAGAQRELKFAQIENQLASAAIDARRAEYEMARRSASDFFTSLQKQVEQGPESILTEVQREALRPLYLQRDEIITLLSRSDPASADRLAHLYVSYRKAIDGSSSDPSPAR